MQSLPLIDGLGRVHKSLRLSVTDRCNIRCFYCMPASNIRFMPRKELLSFEEIHSVVEILADLGVERIRLTGGEPLVRDQLPTLVEKLKAVSGISEVAMTTNAVLLQRHAKALRQAGLDRLNISLDALDPQLFQQITRRDLLSEVLDGIQAARDAGFPIRLNALAIKGISESQIVPLARFAAQHRLELRFIEYMPLDYERTWDAGQVLTAEEILEVMRAEFGELTLAARPDSAQPAVDYRYDGDRGRLGIIHSVTKPFCGTCDRIRLSADGQLQNCLFSSASWDLKQPLRNGTRENVEQEIRRCVAAKQPGHQIGQESFQYPTKSMHQIGG